MQMSQPVTETNVSSVHQIKVKKERPHIIPQKHTSSGEFQRTYHYMQAILFADFVDDDSQLLQAKSSRSWLASQHKSVQLTPVN